MKTRGFTLVELLAAIIIIGILVLLVSTSITNVVKTSKEDLYDNQITLIKQGAEQYVNENIDLLPQATAQQSNIERYILLSDMQESGILGKNIKNPKTNENFTDSDILVKVKVTYNSTYEKCITSYEVITDSERIIDIKESIQKYKVIIISTSVELD